MQVALLGADPTSLELIAWVVQHRGATLIAAYDSRGYADALKDLAPQVRLQDDWEALLANRLQAVVIGRGGDTRPQREEQLRRLAQEALPLVVVCPACEAIVGFEIEMIRQAAGGLILPYLPGLHHPAVQDVATLIQDDTLGQVEQILFERELADRTRTSVLDQLARDLTLLRLWIGRLTSLTASGPPVSSGRDPLGPRPRQLPSLAHLSVHLTGASGRTARWSVVPPNRAEQARITLLGTQGRATLKIPQNGGWKLHVVGQVNFIREYPPQERLDRLWDEVLSAVQTTNSDQISSHRGNDGDSAWLAVCRDQEAAEAVDQSLLQGRAIELLNEPHTEEASFKGAMALAGCGLLLGILLFLIGVAVVEGLRLPIRQWSWWPHWPVLLLVVVLLFLALQGLGALALGAEPSRQRSVQ